MSSKAAFQLVKKPTFLFNFKVTYLPIGTVLTMEVSGLTLTLILTMSLMLSFHNSLL